MRIGELSQRSGVSVRALRYYEQQGLLPARRTSGGHREFLDCAPQRVAWIRRLYASGLNSPMIAQLMPHVNELTITHQSAGHPIPNQVGEQLQSELDRIDGSISDLARSRELLHQLVLSIGAEGESGH